MSPFFEILNVNLLQLQLINLILFYITTEYYNFDRMIIPDTEIKNLTKSTDNCVVGYIEFFTRFIKLIVEYKLKKNWKRMGASLFLIFVGNKSFSPVVCKNIEEK